MKNAKDAQKKKFLLVTDAWSPQTNGVVTTLKTVLGRLEDKGYEVSVIHSGLFKTIPLPSYPEIRVAILPKRKIKKLVEEFAPDHVHIATEGPLGMAAKKLFDKNNQRYTTSLHTKFPEYVNERLPFIKVSWGYHVLNWFHRKAAAVMVTTESMRQELVENGMNADQLKIWGRGVNSDLFQPNPERKTNRDEPVLMYVGRLAVEKNLETFLDIDMIAKKVLVGDGPQRKQLEAKYPDVEFVGYKYGEELVEQFQRADVFVFPSKTDTFGLVMLEAMACGTPVAAYPVAGPIDVVQSGITGYLSDDLKEAIVEALTIDRKQPRLYAEDQSWQKVTERLEAQLVPFLV